MFSCENCKWSRCSGQLTGSTKSVMIGNESLIETRVKCYYEVNVNDVTDRKDIPCRHFMSKIPKKNNSPQAINSLSACLRRGMDADNTNLYPEKSYDTLTMLASLKKVMNPDEVTKFDRNDQKVKDFSYFYGRYELQYRRAIQWAFDIFRELDYSVKVDVKDLFCPSATDGLFLEKLTCLINRITPNNITDSLVKPVAEKVASSGADIGDATQLEEAVLKDFWYYRHSNYKEAPREDYVKYL